MKQLASFSIPMRIQNDIIQGTIPRRFLRCLLPGLGLTLLFVIVESILLLILNPFVVLGHAANRLVALLLLPIHMPLTMLVLSIEYIVFSLLIFSIARPISYMFYLLQVKRNQEAANRTYLPIAALTNLSKTADVYQDDEKSTTIYIEEEQVELQDLMQREKHQVLLGGAGAGKTSALRRLHYTSAQHAYTRAFSSGKIPIYVPLQKYSLYIKEQQSNIDEEMREGQQGTLCDYLVESDLGELAYVRPCINLLAEQGRLLLLCDGLDEVGHGEIAAVSAELVRLMVTTKNRLVIACREGVYRQQAELVQLAEDGVYTCAVIEPLKTEQVGTFVDDYIERTERQDVDGNVWSEEVRQSIEQSRLRYHSTQQMLLFALLEIAKSNSMEPGTDLASIDTRGLLLREYVQLMFTQEQERRGVGPLDTQEVIQLLGEIACAARWANERTVMQVPIAVTYPLTTEVLRAGVDLDEFAAGLRFWLEDHPAYRPFVVEPEVAKEPRRDEDVAQLLEFACAARLIEISPAGILSFRHALIAEYFVAEYFLTYTDDESVTVLALRPELVENSSEWSEVVALWAGLLSNPLRLATAFGTYEGETATGVLQALALGIVCMGVAWLPADEDVQYVVQVPPMLEDVLASLMFDNVACQELASIFNSYAQAGVYEIYHALLPLTMVDGIENFLILLDQKRVSEMLFAHLQEAADNGSYDAQVKRVARILSHYGSAVIERASALSLPEAERSVRLRAVAINILGGTNAAAAVEPLLARLRDAESSIVERATTALMRLGPSLTFIAVVVELEKQATDQMSVRVHRAVLLILRRFMNEQDARRQLSLAQYQRALDSLVPVLTPAYQEEPEAQQLVREMLIAQGRDGDEHDSTAQRQQKVVSMLVRAIAVQNESAVQNVVATLQEIGRPATAHLVALLPTSSEIVRTRVIKILENVRDLDALPALLRLVEDPTPAIQTQIAVALQAYAPESVPGLLEILLHSTTDVVADRAARILVSIGRPVVEPGIELLSTIVPGRTRLLVQVLELIHDQRAVAAFIALLQMPLLEPMLAITTVRALGQFPEKRVIQPLLTVLAAANPQLYEESINALSQLGSVALDELLTALNEEQDKQVAQRMRRAILGMVPFPGERLLFLLEQSQGQGLQAEQILAILQAKGPEGAQLVVANILHRDRRVRDALQKTLGKMAGSVVVPALLDVLDKPELRDIVASFLLKYPDAAIVPLINLLGEQERSALAAALLPQFGLPVLEPLLSALNDPRHVVREAAQNVVVTLVRQSYQPADVVLALIGLFASAQPARARESLIEAVTGELAEISLPVLLERLVDPTLIDLIAQALWRLTQQALWRPIVLERLLQALYDGQRRRGAEVTLIRIGAPAVQPVGELITEPQQAVADAAKAILCEIGVPALAFIWAAHTDRSNVARGAAALEIFHYMRTEVIKDELVALLVSKNRDDIAMAVALLLERIHDEGQQQAQTKHVMVPELFAYIQTHSNEDTNLRIVALLLLLGEQSLASDLVEALYTTVQQRQRLTSIIFLLGKQTHNLLLRMFKEGNMPPDLQADLVGVLSMVTNDEFITDYARDISQYGLSSNPTSIVESEQLTIALRALGGLLASGQWNPLKLQELRDTSEIDAPSYELFNVLLGWRYGPQISMLQNDLNKQKESFTKQFSIVSGQLIEEKQQAESMRYELEKVREEHGTRGNELQQITRERDAMRVRLEQAAREKAALRTSVEQANKEKATLNAQLEHVKQEHKALLQQMQAKFNYPNNPNNSRIK